MIDLLGGGARYNQLIEFAGRCREHFFHVKMRPADFTIRLYCQHTPQQISILRVHFVQIFELDLVSKHDSPLQTR